LLGRFVPIDIHGAYFEGHLHYTVTAVEQEAQLERRVVRVVKSNRTLQEVIESPAREGTQESDRIFRLDDETHVQGVPDNGGHGTWSWESIQDYLDGTPSRPMSALLADIISVLRSRVWVPNDADYYVLALTVMTSYVQELFDAVPLILISGPSNTGKSELSTAMAEIGANGILITQASLATISRTIDECRGLAAFDDLESIGSTGGAAAFTELRQNLKLSYKKSTGRRRVTDGNTGVELRFYGVKVINNTRGTDSILGSRMLQIETAAMPSGTRLSTPSIDTARLRDELHSWAFSNVAAIANAYENFPVASNRSEEITLPLRVLAQLSGDAAFETNLDNYLERFKPATALPLAEFDEQLRILMEKKLAEGEEVVSASNVRHELKPMLESKGHFWPEEVTDGLLGKKLRDLGYIARGAKGKRERRDGHHINEYKLVRPNLGSPNATQGANPSEAPRPDGAGPVMG